MGEEPLTEQANEIAPVKPPCAVTVKVSVAWPPRPRLRLYAVGFNEKSPVELNVAVTDSFAFAVATHVPVPEHAPPQPPKVEPGTGEAVKVTEVPLAKFAEQLLPQSMPAGLLMTLPTPLPARETESVKRDA